MASKYTNFHNRNDVMETLRPYHVPSPGLVFSYRFTASPHQFLWSTLVAGLPHSRHWAWGESQYKQGCVFCRVYGLLWGEKQNRWINKWAKKRKKIRKYCIKCLKKLAYRCKDIGAMMICFLQLRRVKINYVKGPDQSHVSGQQWSRASPTSLSMTMAPHSPEGTPTLCSSPLFS